jgi:hypothetical protein
MPPIDPLLLHAKALADQLIVRVLFTGVIWIQYGWLAGLLTMAVWLIAARLLTRSCYDGMMSEIQRHVEEHIKSCEACRSGRGHDSEQGSEHHDSGHTP